MYVLQCWRVLAPTCKHVLLLHTSDQASVSTCGKGWGNGWVGGRGEMDFGRVPEYTHLHHRCFETMDEIVGRHCGNGSWGMIELQEQNK
eukprot:1159305-Pelagomonas_calceolata.AAC.10